MNNEEKHIGRLIHKKVEQDGRSASWLADKIGCVRGNIYKIYKKEILDIPLLERIGKALGIDFLKHYLEEHKENEKEKIINESTPKT